MKPTGKRKSADAHLMDSGTTVRTKRVPKPIIKGNLFEVFPPLTYEERKGYGWF
jgi:hypothetical protein